MSDPNNPRMHRSLTELNYNEVIEWLITEHRSFIQRPYKPLQNKNIPLIVKIIFGSFFARNDSFNNKLVHELPPIIVLKEKTGDAGNEFRDFSFIGEQQVGISYHLFEKLHIKTQLTQIGAISFVCVTG
jgi:hypothetical protein